MLLVKVSPAPVVAPVLPQAVCVTASLGIFARRIGCAWFGMGPVSLSGSTATCDDGVKNGNEMGVDCGGPNCPSCPSLTSHPYLIIGLCVTAAAAVTATMFLVRRHWKLKDRVRPLPKGGSKSSIQTNQTKPSAKAVRIVCAPSQVWSPTMAGETTPRFSVKRTPPPVLKPLTTRSQRIEVVAAKPPVWTRLSQLATHQFQKHAMTSVVLNRTFRQSGRELREVGSIVVAKSSDVRSLQ
jgi:hypothetical protein